MSDTESVTQGDSVDEVKVLQVAPGDPHQQGGDIYDVAIIGYGPVGVTCANLLGQVGLRVVVLERDPDIFPRARAINIDSEAVRTIASFGLGDEVVQNLHQGVNIRFVNSAGTELVRIASIHGPRGTLQTNFMHQPTVESILREGVRRFPNVEVRAPFEVANVAGGPEFVTIRGANGSEIRARYALGCDGASSTVRKSIGSEYSGRSYEQKWLTVVGRMKRAQGTSRDPNCGPMFGRGPHFQMVCDPHRPLGEIPTPGGLYRFEMQLRPDETPEEFEDEARIWDVLSERSIGPADFEIRHYWSYTFHVRQAAQWRAGRVFLVGDAAHVMPPFIGQGVSAGMRDANNLCWKLIQVLQGGVSERLLDTYQTERSAHVAEFTLMGQRVGQILMVKNPLLVKARDVALRSFSRVGPFRESFSGLANKRVPIRVGCIAPRSKKDKAAGQLFPEFEVFDSEGRLRPIDELFGNDFVFLGIEVDPAVAIPAEVRQQWAAVNPRYLTVRTGRRSCVDGEIADPAGVLWDWFEENHCKIACIRPDKYVYGAGNPTDAVLRAPQELQADRRLVSAPAG